MARKYAQHFLINQHAVDRIAESMGITAGENVLEIGPGKGVLTSRLVARGANVIVVEIDPDMVTLLQSRFGTTPNLKIINSDILDFDLDKVGGDFKIVGNLPYNLTSPILRKLSEWKHWSFATVMVQKEVGDRLCASPGTSDYGALTVGMNLTCVVERVFDLSETSFNPPPRVKSSVIKLIRREKLLFENVDLAQRVIQACFQQRRKTILNSLSHGLQLDKEKIQKILTALNLDETIRPERLTVPQFIELARTVGPELPKSGVGKK